MKIDAYFTPYFPEKEGQFNNAYIVMIDVLRASTVVSAAFYNGAKEIIPCENIDKAVSIFSNLDKDMRFLGGERKGLKPDSFNAGNSPFEYTKEKIEGKTIILTTSNGTKTFNKAKDAKYRIVGAFVNLNIVIEFLKYQLFNSSDENPEIYFLCAGTNGRLSYEDVICAGAFINKLSDQYTEVSLTDTADAARNLYNLHKDDLFDFIRTRSHAVYLSSIGFDKDIELSMSENIFPVIPLIDGHSIKNFIFK